MWSGLARGVGVLTMLLGTAAAVLLVCGFFWFTWQIPDEETQLSGKADGIVVLTGAAARIPDAIDLLAADRGKRLLITGVYRSTRAAAIARLTPANAKYVKCCVDLGHAALNTFGNAIETKRWASEHNFTSLIVVTSNWHMPRAMTELRHQMPLARLIAYPVISENYKNDPWWSSGATARLLFGEYLKYLFALARMRIDPDSIAAG
jgi:uncharacterized SAM-binding protein YcdF (DUF218 family)